MPRDATVLDLAAGHCEFINNIQAGRRIAVDLNPARRQLAQALGATQACDPSEAIAAARSLTDGRGADVVIEAAGRPAVR